MSWQRLKRTTLVDTPFLKVYSDDIKLPNGSLIDYTVVKKRDVVITVATNPDGEVLIQEEYRYAVNKTLLSLPGGQIDANESFEETAKRELLEETGYGSNDFSFVDTLYEYPTKDIHTISVVRAKNVTLKKTPTYEATEVISNQRFISIDELRDQIRQGKWKTAGCIAVLVRALPELFK